MAYQLLKLPKEVPIAAGSIVPGAKLRLYLTGTTTPTPGYSDSALTTPITQPIVADAAGIFQAIYLDPAIVYKATLSTSADVLQYTIDPMNDSVLSSAIIASYLTQTIIGAAFYPRTAAEITAGITPTLYYYQQGDIRRYGAVLTDLTDDVTAIQNAVDVMNASGGGLVRGWEGKTSKTASPIIVKDRVRVDLEGGTIHATLSGANDYGLRLRNNSIVENGTITVTSSGSPGSQHGCHAPILIGPLSGAGGTVASPSVDEGVSGWVARNLTLSSDKNTDFGAFGIQINGAANNGLIDNITIPDSARMFGAIGLDWNYLGTINSSDVPTSRTNFNAGTAYTTHPFNILIQNIWIGELTRSLTGGAGTDTAAHGVRLSGVYNITVKNVRGKKLGECGVRFTAGDLGFEFALAAIKPLAHKNVVFEDCAFQSNEEGYLALVDCYADNVAAAVTGVGYTPLLDPLAYTNVVLRRVTGVGINNGVTTSGIRFNLIRGGTVEDCEATLFAHGVLIEEQCFGTEIRRGRYYNNRDDGIHIEHSTRKPEDIVVDGAVCYGNGIAISIGVGAGVCVSGSKRTVVRNCRFGNPTVASETKQIYGVRVNDTNAVEVTVEDNYANSGKNAASTAYSLLSGTDYGFIKKFHGNAWNASGGFTSGYGGVNIIPTETIMGPDGALRRTFISARASLSGDTTPTAGAWLVGDTIYYQDPVSAGYTCTLCTASGSPGTWKRAGLVT